MLTRWGQCWTKSGFVLCLHLLKGRIDARFAELPKGTDPDQILIHEGAEALQRIIENAHPMVEYLIRQKVPNVAQASPKLKESVCQWMFAAMVEIDSRIALEGYLEQLSRLLNIPIDALKIDFSNYRKNRTPVYRQTSSHQEVQSQDPERLTIVEEDLLFVLCMTTDSASPLANTLDISWVDVSFWTNTRHLSRKQVRKALIYHTHKLKIFSRR